MSGRIVSGPPRSAAARVRSLAARRRRSRRLALIALALLAALALGAIIWGAWRPQLRIRSVRIAAGDPALAAYAASALAGTYAGLIPRDSAFFFPAQDIRDAVLANHPEIAAVSILRTAFSELSIRAEPRVPVARWCGSTPLTTRGSALLTAGDSTAAPCYFFDLSGFIYAPAPAAASTSAATTSLAATSTPPAPINLFVLYAPLAAGEPEPLRATIAAAGELPSAFDFARRLASFGSPTVSVFIHDGEADDTLASGSRVFYLLGGEQGAFTALVSAKGNFNLADGSIDYLDLRFPGKVYLKRNKE